MPKTLNFHESQESREFLGRMHKYNEVNQLFKTQHRILLMMSGGLDSTALFYLFVQFKQEFGLHFEVLHINYKTRGQDSDQDEAFVQSLCSEYEVALEVLTVLPETLSHCPGEGFQDKARQFRYAAALKLKKQKGFDRIATAHSQSDQAETVLWRILKGTGLRGLAGIPAKNHSIIRPLLPFSRVEIETFLNHHGLVHRVDKSNSSDKYERNRIRTSLMVQAKESVNPQVEIALSELAQRAHLDNAFMEHEVELRLTHADAEYDGNSVNLAWFLDQPLSISQRLIRRLWDNAGPVNGKGRELGRHQRWVVEGLLAGQTGGSLPGGVSWRVQNTRLTLVRRKEPEAVCEDTIILALPGLTSLRGAGIVLEVRGPIPVPDKAYWKGHNHRCLIDIATIKQPLKLRFPKAGDRFLPFGAPGTQKLSDFFVNQKVPSELRPSIPLLVCGREILWIVGYRTAEFTRLSETSQMVYEVVAHVERG